MSKSPEKYGDTAIAAKVSNLVPHESGLVMALDVAGVKTPYLLDWESSELLLRLANREFMLLFPKDSSGKPIPEPLDSIADAKREFQPAEAGSFRAYEEGILISFRVEGKFVCYFLDNENARFYGAVIADHFKLFQLSTEVGSSKLAPLEPS